MDLKPPEEPFAYMSDPNGYRKIRSPLGLTLFSLFVFAIGVSLFILTQVLAAQRQASNFIGLGAFIMVLFCGLGITLFVIGIKRLRWKREYVRVTGHQPWT